MNYHDNAFQYAVPVESVPTPLGPGLIYSYALCGLNLFIRDVTKDQDLDDENHPEAVCLISQIPNEIGSIMDHCPAICASVYSRLFLAAGYQIFPCQVIWVLNFPEDNAGRYRRMERVLFQNTIVFPGGKSALFANPNWHRITVGLVERLMGMKWDEMGLPIVERFVG